MAQTDSGNRPLLIPEGIKKEQQRIERILGEWITVDLNQAGDGNIAEFNQEQFNGHFPNLRLRATEQDGHCLFTSISLLTRGSNQLEVINELRTIAAEELVDNPASYADGASTEEVKQYGAAITPPSTELGDDRVIRALVNRLHFRVKVLRSLLKGPTDTAITSYEPEPHLPAEELANLAVINLALVNRNHYCPIFNRITETIVPMQDDGVIGRNPEDNDDYENLRELAKVLNIPWPMQDGVDVVMNPAWNPAGHVEEGNAVHPPDPVDSAVVILPALKRRKTDEGTTKEPAPVPDFVSQGLSQQGKPPKNINEIIDREIEASKSRQKKERKDGEYAGRDKDHMNKIDCLRFILGCLLADSSFSTLKDQPFFQYLVKMTAKAILSRSAAVQSRVASDIPSTPVIEAKSDPQTFHIPDFGDIFMEIWGPKGWERIYDAVIQTSFKDKKWTQNFRFQISNDPGYCSWYPFILHSSITKMPFFEAVQWNSDDSKKQSSNMPSEKPAVARFDDHSLMLKEAWFPTKSDIYAIAVGVLWNPGVEHRVCILPKIFFIDVKIEKDDKGETS